jgi:hypothetical protein
MRTLHTASGKSLSSRQMHSRTSQKVAKGSFQPMGFIVILFLFFASGGYLYSVNQNAVQGFHMRQLEKEIRILKEANAQLQIDEADKRSLARIEESAEARKMKKVEVVSRVNIEEERVALR